MQIQCLNADGSGGGCEKLGGAATFAHVRVSPDGANVYVSDNRTLVPLVRNADGRLAPILDSSGFGKQAGCMSFHASGIGCLGTQVRGSRSTSSSSRRTASTCMPAATSSVAMPRPASSPHRRPRPVSHTTGIALSPDGRSVYYGEGVNGTRVLGFARDPATQQLTPLPPPLGCLSSNGAGGCQTAVGGPGFRGAMTFDPSGATFYVPSGLVSSATTRNFSRVAAPPLPPLAVGRGEPFAAALDGPRPRAADTHVGAPAQLERPRAARAAAAGRRAADGPGRVRQAQRPRARGRAAARAGRLPRQRSGRPQAHAERRRRAVASGRLIVDAIAADRGGRRQTIHQVGELTVRR